LIRKARVNGDEVGFSIRYANSPIKLVGDETRVVVPKAQFVEVLEAIKADVDKAVLEPEQFAIVLAYTDTMDRAPMYRFMVTLSMKLGLRPIELANMETSWFIGDELQIPHGKSKRGKARTLPVNDDILAQLQNLIGENDGQSVPQCAWGCVYCKRDQRGYASALQAGRCGR